MTDVFLSYTRQDVDVASRLTDELLEAGVSVFWDHDMPPGTRVAGALSQAMARARVFVHLVPAQQGRFSFVQKEVEAAIALNGSTGLAVLPVVLPGREPTGASSHFRYLRISTTEDLGPIVQVVKQTLSTAQMKSPTADSLRLSFFASLLTTDLALAPRAAAIVLDEIGQSVDPDNVGGGRQLSILRSALQWGEAELGSDHPSATFLRYRLTEALLHSGNYDEAIALGYQVFERSTLPRDKLEASVNLSNALIFGGRSDEAEKICQVALELALETESEAVASTLLVALGTIARGQGRLERARQHFEEALHLTARLAQPSARVNALIALCEIAALAGDLYRSRWYAKEALWLSRTALSGDDALALRAAALVGPEEVEQ